jgi:hypothetical protein
MMDWDRPERGQSKEDRLDWRNCVGGCKKRKEMMYVRGDEIFESL